MPERNIDSSFWNDPDVESLSPEAKLIYLYAWTNDHCSSAGIYAISLRTISNETGLGEDSIRNSLRSLQDKITWLEDQNIIWVKAFLKRQSRSPKYLTGVVRSLRHLPENIVIDFLNFNHQRYNLRLPIEVLHTLSIPYEYPIDRVSIPSISGLVWSGSGNSSNNNSSDKGIRGDSKGGEGDQPEQAKELAVIAQVYESNIGMITPVIADELRDIAKVYPPGWFAAAVKEAIDNNARKLKYVRSILERWNVEGFKTPLKKASQGSKPKRKGKLPSADELDEQERRFGMSSD